jgi:hypothetical protein
MAAQQKPGMTLVIQGEPQFTIRAGEWPEFRGQIYLLSFRPQNVSVVGDQITGTLSPNGFDKYPWTTAPHVALANLPTFDAQKNFNMKPGDGLHLDAEAAAKFVRDYGFLHNQVSSKDSGAPGVYAGDSAGRRIFRFLDSVIRSTDSISVSESLANVAIAQQTLRKAWMGESSIADADTETVDITVNGYGKLEIITTDLWKFISLLFLLYANAGKLGTCANPDCVAPYFIKKRRTQKFCEAGPCTAYAARQYTKQWWDSKGKKRRDKKQAKARRGKS